MPLSLEQERAQIEADEQRLADRRKKLAEKERTAAVTTIEKSGLMKLDTERLTKLMARVKALGVDEVEKRLA